MGGFYSLNLGRKIFGTKVTLVSSKTETISPEKISQPLEWIEDIHDPALDGFEKEIADLPQSSNGIESDIAFGLNEKTDPEKRIFDLSDDMRDSSNFGSSTEMAWKESNSDSILMPVFGRTECDERVFPLDFDGFIPPLRHWLEYPFSRLVLVGLFVFAGRELLLTGSADWLYDLH